LERLTAPFSDPQIGLAYGKQRGAPQSHFSEHQIFAHWFPDTPQPRQNHPFCNNANAAIRLDAWRRMPYDETLTGLEDLAWAKALQESGGAIAYVPEAEIIHIHHETPRGVYNRYRREAMAFKRIYPKERFSLLDFVRLSWGNIASDVWHANQQSVLSRHWRSIFWFRLAQFWGTYQGYRHPGPVTATLRQTFYYPRAIGDSTQASPRPVEPIKY
jgi:GT2 family glycosyltransferase